MIYELDMSISDMLIQYLFVTHITTKLQTVSLGTLHTVLHTVHYSTIWVRAPGPHYFIPIVWGN